MAPGPWQKLSFIIFLISVGDCLWLSASQDALQGLEAKREQGAYLKESVILPGQEHVRIAAARHDLSPASATKLIGLHDSTAG